MAKNLSLVPEDEESGEIDLTLLAPSETDERLRTALLTTRSKDTRLTAKELERLGKACLRYAKDIREKG